MTVSQKMASKEIDHCDERLGMRLRLAPYYILGQNHSFAWTIPSQTCNIVDFLEYNNLLHQMHKNSLKSIGWLA